MGHSNNNQFNNITGRDDYWDSAKGVLICLVVIGHLLELTADYIPESLYVWTIIYIFHMPAFLFISGYLVRLSNRNPVRRIPKLVFLYVFVQYTAHILGFITGKSSEWYGNLISPTLGAWYLLFLIYANILAFFLKDSLNPNKTWIHAAVLIGCMAGFDASINNKGGISRFLVFLVFFLAGYSGDWNSLLKRLRKKRILLISSSVIAATFFVIMQYEGVFQRETLGGAVGYTELYPGEEWKGLLFRFILYFISMLITLAFLTIVPKRNKVLSMLGKNSLYIYIIHVLIIAYLYEAFSRVINIDSQIGKTLLVSGLTVFALTVFIIVVVKGIAIIKNWYHRQMAGVE